MCRTCRHIRHKNRLHMCAGNEEGSAPDCGAAMLEASMNEAGAPEAAAPKAADAPLDRAGAAPKRVDAAVLPGAAVVDGALRAPKPAERKFIWGTLLASCSALLELTPARLWASEGAGAAGLLATEGAFAAAAFPFAGVLKKACPLACAAACSALLGMGGIGGALGFEAGFAGFAGCAADGWLDGCCSLGGCPLPACRTASPLA